MTPRALPRWTRLIATTALVGVVATGCGVANEATGSPVPTSSTTGAEAVGSTPAADDADIGAIEPRLLSAEEGVTARARYEPLKRSAEAASGALAADVSTMDCPSTDVPTAEEVAEANTANTANEGLIDAFDRFGVAYTSSTDGLGYLMVVYAYNDVVAQSVADSYWNALYPVTPIPQEELDAVISQNNIIAEQLEAAGVTYERHTDDFGYESIEYDDDDPAAQAAIDAAWLIISPPQPPTPEQLAQQTDDNIKLTNAFDDAGIAYELVTDELGWAWVEWDADDPATSEQYFAILDELYPPIAIEPLLECALVEEPIAIDMPTLDVQPVDPLIDPMPVDELGEAPVDAGPTPEQIAQNAAEIDAIVAGFASASVDFELVGESPWQTVVFDVDNPSSVPVITDVLAARA